MLTGYNLLMKKKNTLFLNISKHLKGVVTTSCCFPFCWRKVLVRKCRVKS